MSSSSLWNTDSFSMADAGGSGRRRTGDEWRRGDLADAMGLVGWSEGFVEEEGRVGDLL